jgi:hypothetical protein
MRARVAKISTGGNGTSAMLYGNRSRGSSFLQRCATEKANGHLHYALNVQLPFPSLPVRNVKIMY